MESCSVLGGFIIMNLWAENEFHFTLMGVVLILGADYEHSVLLSHSSLRLNEG
jgi:hypothetical protein